MRYKQHVWFGQKIDFRNEKNRLRFFRGLKTERRVDNDGGERWSLYTEEGRTRRPSLLGRLFPSLRSPVSFAPVDGSTEAPRCNRPTERADGNQSAYRTSRVFLKQPFLGFLRRLGQEPSGVPQRPVLALPWFCFLFFMLLVSAARSHMTLT